MKILYGVQGTGNGHIARSRAMALAFAKVGTKVDFLFSGRNPDHYFSMEDFGKYQTRQGLTFQSHHGKIDIMQTLRQAQPRQFLAEVRQLDVSAYDLVINDFEPVTAWAARQQKIPCIGISHQNSFRYSIPAANRGWLDRLIVKYFAPCDYPIGLHWHHFNQPLLPPVIHIQAEQISGDADSKESVAPTPHLDLSAKLFMQQPILVYLPFEDLTQITKLLQQLQPQVFVCYHPGVHQAQQQENILLKPLSHQLFMRDLHLCMAVISNAGFELPSEALTLGKKLLVKPLVGQFEQQSNANTLARLGLGTCLHRLDVAEIRDWLTTAQAVPLLFPHVASAVVDWLMSGQWQEAGSLEQLSQQLWSQVQYPLYAKAEAGR